MYEDLPAFYVGDFGRVRGQHYDIVLNGVEIGGGSVRIHDHAMQEYVFRNVLQVSTNNLLFYPSFCAPPFEFRPLYAKASRGFCVYRKLLPLGPSGQCAPKFDTGR